MLEKGDSEAKQIVNTQLFTRFFPWVKKEFPELLQGTSVIPERDFGTLYSARYQHIRQTLHGILMVQNKIRFSYLLFFKALG